MEILGAIGAQCTARNPPTSRVATVHFEPTPGKDAFPEAVAAAPGNLHLPQAQLKKRKKRKGGREGQRKEKKGKERKKFKMISVHWKPAGMWNWGARPLPMRSE